MKKHHIIKLLLLFLLNVEIRSQQQRIITFEISRATWMKKARSLFLKTFKDIPQKKKQFKNNKLYQFCVKERYSINFASRKHYTFGNIITIILYSESYSVLSNA